MKNRCLQRIQDGLPLRVVIQADRLDLFDRASSDLLGQILLNEPPGDLCGQIFFATLEAAQGRELISEADLRRKPLAVWMLDPEVSGRLVLDQNREGEPVFEPIRLVAQIPVVSRPVLFEEAGLSAWKLAHSMPCRTVRIYQFQAEGHWLMTEEIRKDEEVPPQQAASEAVRLTDCFSRWIESIPNRPCARAWTCRGSRKGFQKHEMWQFSLGFGDPNQTSQSIWLSHDSGKEKVQ
ncbi:MAG: hypothetical protein DIKNOCCD_02413 [bacterium]|nr:hypothetical protein [bacterium]